MTDVCDNASKMVPDVSKKNIQKVTTFGKCVRVLFLTFSTYFRNVRSINYGIYVHISIARSFTFEDKNSVAMKKHA